MSKIGFIGLGNMGLHMARNLMKNGHKLTVFDALQSPMQTLQKEGASVAKYPAEVAESCHRIVTMLPSSPHVIEVYKGKNGLLSTLQSDTICLDSSTIDPSVSIEMSEAALEKGAYYIDAPVSGGVPAAENAQLTFMCGGDAKAFEEAKPILSQMGANVIHTGKSGTGQAVKICNNMLLAITMIGTAEAMNLGMKLGLDGKQLQGILSKATGRCWAMDTYNPVPGVIEGVPSSRNYDGGFGTRLMTKDLGLAQNAATTTHCPTPLGSLSHQLYRVLSETEWGEKDFSSIFQFLAKQSQK